jgi:membrane associated rhomboid family serine protease
MTTARRRAGGDLGSAFTFGGRVPASIGLLVALLVGGTVVGWITGLSYLAALEPARLVRGEVWRLVSWVFVQPPGDVLGLLFGGLVLWQTGQQFAYTWGERRFVGRFFALAAAASVVTTAVSFVWPAAGAAHLGIWPVAIALWYIRALLIPDEQITFMFVLPMTGRTFGYLLVFGTLLFGLANGGIRGLATVVPHFAALGLAYAFARGAVLPTRRWTLATREWWQERQFRRRSRHLKVVKKNGSSEPPRWMN